MIIVYNGNQKILEIFKQFIYQVHVFGHQIFSYIIGKIYELIFKKKDCFFVSKSADDNFEGTMKTNLVVQANGSILFAPPGIFKSICPFNIASFPFVSFKNEFFYNFIYLYTYVCFFWIFKIVH